MAQRILDGLLSKNQYQYSKDIVINSATGEKRKTFFTTYQVYNRSVDQSGVLDQGTLQTYQLVNKGGTWYKGARLGEDGKWKALTEKEGGIYVPNDDPTKPGTFKPIPDASNAKILGEGAIRDLNAEGTNSLRYQAINNAKFQLKKGGGLNDQQVNTEFDISSNIAPPGQPGTPGLFGPAIPAESGTGTQGNELTPLSPEDAAYIKKQNEESKEGTRKETEYESVVYPEGLSVAYQDCIKFTIVKYKPSGLTGFESSDAGSRFVDVSEGKPGFSKGKDRIPIATIVLPIPGGIQDSNTVNWSNGNLDPITQAFGDLAETALKGENVGAAAQRQGERAVAANNEIRKRIISWATQTAISGNNVMQRQYGAIVNPNIELLFNSPDLRTFSFSFKLSPRSSREAQKVKTIIRNFKQAMSVKRSSSSFLLQSPHTFAISYIFQNKAHPYLNRFKECALISCNVNYTPEGNYMAFDDSEHPSMVSYQLDLIFQELEPLYDDEYGDGYNNIGF